MVDGVCYAGRLFPKSTYGQREVASLGMAQSNSQQQYLQTKDPVGRQRIDVIIQGKKGGRGRVGSPSNFALHGVGPGLRLRLVVARMSKVAVDRNARGDSSQCRLLLLLLLLLGIGKHLAEPHHIPAC